MNKEYLIEALRLYGRTKAQELRNKAPNMTDTEIINDEDFIPIWKPGPQILGAPVQFNNQVYRVLQAHDSTGNETWNPINTPALFGICHTTNPQKAKYWIQPLGISGVYKINECYKDENEQVWQQTYDGDNVYDAETLPERWNLIIP